MLNYWNVSVFSWPACTLSIQIQGEIIWWIFLCLLQTIFLLPHFLRGIFTWLSRNFRGVALLLRTRLLRRGLLCEKTTVARVIDELLLLHFPGSFVPSQTWEGRVGSEKPFLRPWMSGTYCIRPHWDEDHMWPFRIVFLNQRPQLGTRLMDSQQTPDEKSDNWSWTKEISSFPPWNLLH